MRQRLVVVRRDVTSCVCVCVCAVLPQSALLGAAQDQSRFQGRRHRRGIQSNVGFTNRFTARFNQLSVGYSNKHFSSSGFTLRRQ